MKVANLYGMIQPGESQTAAVRAVFFVDPKGVLRAMIYYPLALGRNFDEIKRVLVGLQAIDAFGVAMPVSYTHLIFVRNLTKLRLMAKIKGTVVVDKERCKGCGVCVASCPCNVLGMSAEVNSKGYPVARMANPDACIGCASCAVICPDSVITVYRQKIE